MIEWSLTWYIFTFVSRSHFLCWKALEPKAVSSTNSLEGRVQRGGSPVVQDQRQQSESQRLKCRRFPLNIRKQFVNCESDQTMAKVAQRDGGVSILANTQKLPGHGLGKQDLGRPPRAWVLDWVTSRGLGKLQPSCNSGILFLWSTVVSVFSQSRTNLIIFMFYQFIEFQLLAHKRLSSSWTAPGVCGLCLFPSLFWYYIPPQSVRQNLQKVFNKIW